MVFFFSKSIAAAAGRVVPRCVFTPPPALTPCASRGLAGDALRCRPFRLLTVVRPPVAYASLKQKKSSFSCDRNVPQTVRFSSTADGSRARKNARIVRDDIDPPTICWSSMLLALRSLRKTFLLFSATSCPLLVL